MYSMISCEHRSTHNKLQSTHRRSWKWSLAGNHAPRTPRSRRTQRLHQMDRLPVQHRGHAGRVVWITEYEHQTIHTASEAQPEAACTACGQSDRARTHDIGKLHGHRDGREGHGPPAVLHGARDRRCVLAQRGPRCAASGTTHDRGRSDQTRQSPPRGPRGRRAPAGASSRRSRWQCGRRGRAAGSASASSAGRCALAIAGR